MSIFSENTVFKCLPVFENTLYTGFIDKKTIYSFDGIEKQSKSSSSSVTSVKSAKSFTFGFQGFNVGNHTGVKQPLRKLLTGASGVLEIQKTIEKPIFGMIPVI